jgi:hypothetical protein
LHNVRYAAEAFFGLKRANVEKFFLNVLMNVHRDAGGKIHVPKLHKTRRSGSSVGVRTLEGMTFA